jgi:protease-4
MEQTQDVPGGGTGQGGGTPRRRSRLLWLWIALAVLLVCVAPAVGCGAFGVVVAAASAGGTTSGSLALGPSVGLIEVSGQILSGASGGFNPVAGSATIIDLIEQADADANIKAIVLRIDSPGGGVVASDEIYHALTQVDKPIVVSMGSLAASGGYYIAAPADYIYATPYTLTGSIGVISQFFVAEDLLEDIGVDVVVITAGDVKDFGSFHREMTDEERAYWQALIDEIHGGFIERVAEGRDMPVEDVRAIADGRVILGEEAVDLGLVDEIGYLEDAVAKAGELGGIGPSPNVVELRPEVSFIDALYGFQSQQDISQALDVLLRSLQPPSLDLLYLGQ